jgi:hypothetical protein
MKANRAIRGAKAATREDDKRTFAKRSTVYPARFLSLSKDTSTLVPLAIARSSVLATANTRKDIANERSTLFPLAIARSSVSAIADTKKDITNERNTLVPLAIARGSVLAIRKSVSVNSQQTNGRRPYESSPGDANCAAARDLQ